MAEKGHLFVFFIGKHGHYTRVWSVPEVGVHRAAQVRVNRADSWCCLKALTKVTRLGGDLGPFPLIPSNKGGSTPVGAVILSSLSARPGLRVSLQQAPREPGSPPAPKSGREHGDGDMVVF